MSDVGIQYESRAAENTARQFGMWVFLATEIMFFSGMFLCYTIYRSLYPGEFARGSELLHRAIGVTNTVVLLTSSLTMALTVERTREGRRREGLFWGAGTIALGALFLVFKAYEYWSEYEEGFVAWRLPPMPAGRALFFCLYYLMTGVHAVHLTIGIAVLSVVLWRLRRVKHMNEGESAVSLTGLYWHFVDAVWVVLLPLLYLVGG